MINEILICNVFLLILILVSSKVESFHNGAHSFLSTKLGTNVLTLPLGVLYKSAILKWYPDSSSLLISVLSGAKRYSLCNSRNSFGY